MKPPALHLRKSVFIACPVEQVWSFLNDESNDTSWRRPYCKELKRAGELGTGTRFDGIDNMGPYTTEIIEFRPPLRLVWREVSIRPLQQRQGSYNLEPEGAGTRATIDLSYQTNGIRGALMLPIVRQMKKSLGNKLASQLKAGVEGKPARG